MLVDSAAAKSVPSGDPSVAILMATRDGAAFLREQLASVAAQTHRNWRLIASDDGSIDPTRTILEAFAAEHPSQVTVRGGPRKGVCANFLSLAADPSIAADYFAFSDQDDIWRPQKLTRGLSWLSTIAPDIPALYAGRTELMTADGLGYGWSPLFTRPPAFANAIVQSLAGGNTIMFNRAAKRLLERAGQIDVALHDWWIYQLVTAAGGVVRYDPEPTVRYRQHSGSLIGSNIGVRARIVRFGLMLTGRFRIWNAMNTAALQTLPDDMITPENRKVLEFFARARKEAVLKRLFYLRRSGVYRQTWQGNLALVIGAIIKRI